LRGWVSQAGLMPYQPPVRVTPPVVAMTSPVAPPVVAQASQDSHLECEPPVMVSGGGGYDPNPVVRTDIRYGIDGGSWYVRHILRSGQIVSRDEQYAMNDESNLDIKVLRWTGTWVRNPAVYMVGAVDRNPRGELVYAETQYKNNALQFQSQARCHVVSD
jgi:hypothetical protein